MSPDEEVLIGNALESKAQVEAPSEQVQQRKSSWKTKVLYLDRAKETIISIQPPRISPAGVIEFLMSDRLKVVNLSQVLNFEVEQLAEPLVQI